MLLWINVEEAKIPSYIKLLFVRSRGPWTSIGRQIDSKIYITGALNDFVPTNIHH